MNYQKSAKNPIIIADPQDNPGAGASGDSTDLISRLLKHKIPALVGMFWDPDAADACHNAGDWSKNYTRYRWPLP